MGTPEIMLCGILMFVWSFGVLDYAFYACIVTRGCSRCKAAIAVRAASKPLVGPAAAPNGGVCIAAESHLHPAVTSKFCVAVGKLHYVIVRCDIKPF